MKPAILAGFLLGYCVLSSEPAHGAEIHGHLCGFAPIDSERVVTAKHCVTGEEELPLNAFKRDWTIIDFPHSQPVKAIRAMTYMELRHVGPRLSFAGKTGCSVISFPLGEGAFALSCSAKRGDSGSGVYLDDTFLVGVISGFLPEGNAIVTSATQFEGTAP